MTDSTTGLSEQGMVVLEYFTRRCLAPPADFDHLYGARPDHATAMTYFLLDLVSGPQPTPPGGQDLSMLAGVNPFMQHTLARLLLQLSHSTEQRSEIYHSQVRGRILWNATYKERFSEDYNPTIYVCAQVRQRYDNPENQLLKYLFVQIEAGLKFISPAIRSGICYLPQGESRLPQNTASRLEALEIAIHRSKRNVRLREISTPNEISERHLLRAGTSRTEEYNAAADLYNQYKCIVLRPSWKSLAAAARRILPLPDKLNETTRSWVELAADLRSCPL